MAKVGVNIKLEAQLKAEFEAFCSELRLTMTDALRHRGPHCCLCKHQATSLTHSFHFRQPN